MKMFLMRGVPASVQTDGWWINKDGGGRIGRGGAGSAQATGGGLRLAGLIGLLALADMMIWQVAAGVSLVVFAMAVLIVAHVVAGQKGAGGIAAATLFFLPVVESVQVLSVLFWLAGLVLGAAWIALAKWPGLTRWITAGLRFLGHAPTLAIRDLRTRGQDMQFGYDLRKALSGWGVPLGLGAVFVALILAANPMVQGWLAGFLAFGWLNGMDINRGIFLGLMALLIWPFLVLSGLRERLKLPFAHADMKPVPPADGGLINGASVRRSLILFNLVFALQTGMDVTYLWGGADLPDGIGYAQYAHRGAYPLVVMALLAGVFALISRPFVQGNRTLKAALLIWVAQTVLLVASSLLRLDLYVGVYGLTRLRMAAILWMAVVVLGLLLVIWQVLRGYGAKWLLARTALLGIGVLYGACFYSFDGAIARYNLTHTVPSDPYYICSLGASALPEIRAYEARSGERFCHSDAPQTPQFSDWREWGFRDWRVQRNLAEMTIENRMDVWPKY